MPAVPSPGELCEEHGYTYEWASGQKPQLTKQGKKHSCKTEDFVPLVVPGLSSSSGASLSSTSPPQDSSRTSSSPAEVRSDDEARRSRRDPPKAQIKKKRGTTMRQRKNRLRDLAEWLEEFTDNLEDTEMPAPAHISHDTDSERPTKVASKKHRIFTQSPERRKLRHLHANQNNRSSLQETHY